MNFKLIIKDLEQVQYGGERDSNTHTMLY